MNLEKEQLNFVETPLLQPWQEKIRSKVNVENLPVFEKQEEIIEWLEACLDNGNIGILHAETGSGKSILVFEMLDQILKKRGLNDKILSIQPRRDAAVGVSRAASAVSGYSWGEKGRIGCSTSEAKEVGWETQMRVVTSGIAVRYLADMYKHFVKYGDSYLPNFGAIVVDECHDNSIDYHLILGILKKMRDEGFNCPFTLLTSATMNKEKTMADFSIEEEKYMSIEGRAYPIDISYKKETEDDEKLKLEEEASGAVREMLNETDGDILVFMPGVKQIDETIKTLADLEGVELVSLHGGLDPEEREYAITSEPKSGYRRVVVATNIAETSLTLPRITGVVDSCRYYCHKYNPVTGVDEKSMELISKKASDQRAGRAGRVQAGKCRRLVTGQEWEKMDEHTMPEIKLKNLSHVVLKIKGLEMDAQSFPFPEKPDQHSLEAAEKELNLLGALDEKGMLTPIGKKMLEMSYFGPDIARSIIEARERNCVESALVLATFDRQSRERNSVVFYQPSQRDYEKKQEEILSQDGYVLQSRKPLILLRSGVEIENSMAQQIMKGRRAIAQDIVRNEYEQKQSRFGKDGSDWQRNLNLFAEALEKGVFELATREKTPAWKSARDSFARWAKENKVNDQELIHTASNIYDYSNKLGLVLDRNLLKQKLLASDWESLSRVLLVGHPHKLMYLAGSYGMPDYRKFLNDDDYSDVEINISRGSAAFARNPVCCIGAKIQEGPGTRSGFPITRNYATGVHPISFQQIKEIFPHFVQYQESESGLFDGEVVIVDRYSPIDKRTIIGTENRMASKQEALEYFADKLADIYGTLKYRIPIAEKNAELYRELQRFESMFGGDTVRLPDMTQWYREKLSAIEGKLTVEKIVENQELLKMERRDFISEKLENQLVLRQKEDEERERRYHERMEEMRARRMQEEPSFSYGRSVFDVQPASPKLNPMAEALKSAGLSSEKEESVISAAREPYLFERQYSQQRIRRTVDEILPQTDLPHQLFREIESIKDLEKKWELIGLELQQRGKMMAEFDEKISALEQSEKAAELLSANMANLRKEIQKKEAERKKLTNRSSDKAKDTDLRQQAESLKRLLKADETKLEPLRAQKRELIEIEKKKSQLQKEVTELEKMEADVVEKLG